MAETLDDPVDTKLIPDAARDEPVVTPDPAPTDGKTVETPADKPVDKPVEKVVEPAWPADWREKAAAGDEKKLAKLSRYASPQAVADAMLAAQAKLGEKGTRLPKDATDEQVAAWREENGIPDKPEKYDLGLEIQQQDKALVDKFLGAAHGANMTPAQVKASLESYYSVLEDAKAARETLDRDIQTKAEDELRQEWGDEYRRNVGLITNMLDSAGEGVRDKILMGRLSDGTPIGSSPQVLKFLTALALERNPTGTVVTGGTANDATVAAEIEKIEKTMRENRSTYNKDEKMQERYRSLLAWRENQKR